LWTVGRLPVVTPLMLTPFLILACCNDMPAAISDRISPNPGSGMYASPNGESYKVSTTGPTPLNVRAVDGDLCLLFWKLNNQLSPDTVELRGQECSNRTFGDLAWRASFRKETRGTILIRPPRELTGSKDIVVELKRAG